MMKTDSQQLAPHMQSPEASPSDSFVFFGAAGDGRITDFFRVAAIQVQFRALPCGCPKDKGERLSSAQETNRQSKFSFGKSYISCL
jgi:hypothetical protein